MHSILLHQWYWESNYLHNHKNVTHSFIVVVVKIRDSLIKTKVYLLNKIKTEQSSFVCSQMPTRVVDTQVLRSGSGSSYPYEEHGSSTKANHEKISITRCIFSATFLQIVHAISLSTFIRICTNRARCRLSSASSPTTRYGSSFLRLLWSASRRLRVLSSFRLLHLRHHSLP